MTPRPAHAVADMLGLVVHGGPVDDRPDRHVALHTALLARHARSGPVRVAGPDRAAQRLEMEALASIGVDVTAIMSRTGLRGPTTAERYAEASSNWSGVRIAAAEMVNEAGRFLSPPAWAATKAGQALPGAMLSPADTVAVAAEFGDTLRRLAPDLDRLGPSMAQQHNLGWADVLGDRIARRGDATVANAHHYPGGLTAGMGTRATDALLCARRIAGVQRVQVTETGMHDRLDTTGGHYPVDQAAQALLWPRHLLELHLMGVERVFVYEACDEPGKDDHESAFGLSTPYGDGVTLKPGGQAVARWQAMMHDPGEPLAQPAAVDLAVDVAPGSAGEVGAQVFARRDGTLLLALWQPGVLPWRRLGRTAQGARGEAVQVAPVVARVAGTELRARPLEAVDVATGATQPCLAAEDGAVRVAVHGGVTVLRLGPRWSV